MKASSTIANAILFSLIFIALTGCTSEKKFEGDGYSISLVDGLNPTIFSNRPEAKSWANHDHSEVFSISTADPIEEESEKLKYIEDQFLKAKKEAGYDIDLEEPPSLTTPVAAKESFSLVSGGYTVKCITAFLPKRTYFLTVVTISPVRTEEISQVIETLVEH